MAKHDWGPSLVGHGEKQCQRCGMTNREAWVLGDQCPKPALPDVKCERAGGAEQGNLDRERGNETPLVTPLIEPVQNLTWMPELGHKALETEQALTTLGEIVRDSSSTLTSMQRERDEAFAALGPDARWMDPPDGGSPSLGEQIRRMRQDIEKAEARVAELEAGLVKADRLLVMAFNRIHCLPRTSDTELADRIERGRAEISSLLKRGSNG